jgi:hypothetical protein
MELAQLTSAMSSIREASPQDRGAALVAHLSAATSRRPSARWMNLEAAYRAASVTDTE